MLIGRLLRYAEILGLVAWTVLIILQLVFDSERFLFLLVYVLHFMAAGGAFQFTQETERATGAWFYIALIAAGLIADSASLTEHIIDCVHSGFDALRIAEIILWCWAIVMDIAYIVWCLVVYCTIRPRFRPSKTV